VKTDLAVRGEGFFVVQKGDQNYLTRAGNFHVNERGELLTQFGQKQFAVLDDALSPIVINRADPNWEFSPTGQLRQGGASRNLALVQPESLGDLAREGENLFRPLGEFAPVPGGERQVAVGFLEGSGVQPTSEMIEMIETSRAVEANVNMMHAQDEMLSGLINRVMRV
jgi:flagellar basal-body rod protein FlgF/flagellar basal-body rod protein FlgG